MAGSDRPPNVLIAGAGIGGLTAALALSGVGLRVIIVERAPELAAIGAGLQLSPNATRILRRLGLLDAIAAVASRPRAIRVRSGRTGRTLSMMGLDDAEARWGAPYLVVKRADLQRVLLAAVEADAGISLRLGTGLAGFGTTAQGVQASLKVGMVGRTLSADALVGADGVHSAVRARLVDGTPDAPQETGRTAWRALVESARLASPPPNDETGLWLGPNAHLVHYPVDGGRLVNVVAITRDTTRDPDSTWALPGDPAVLQSRFAKWPVAARGLIAAATGWATWPLYDRAPLTSWNAGPVALLGDAAHPILPFLAQGAAQAIEDAAALANAFGGARHAADAFAAYSCARMVRATRVQTTSRDLGRIYHLTGPAAVARDLTMRLAGGRRLLSNYNWLYAP